MRALLDQEIDMVELFEDTGSDDEEFEKGKPKHTFQFA